MLAFGETCEANALLVPAEQAYETCAELDPADAVSGYHLARLHARRGEVEAALELAAAAAERAPDYAPLHWRSGLWWLQLGRLEQARAAFELAHTLDPGGWISRAGLARVALQEGRPEQAVELLERVLAKHLAAGRADEARRHLTAALANGVDHYRLHLNLGLVARVQGEPEEALAHVGAALERHPTFAPAWQLRGKLHVDRGE